MRFTSILTLATTFTASFVAAAPATGSAVNIMKRSENGASIIDFEYVAKAMRDLSERSASGNVNEAQKRDDEDFIDQLVVQLHNSDLLNEFVDQLTSSPRLKDAVHEGVVKAIGDGNVDDVVVFKALRNSGKLQQFFESVLNDEDLNGALSKDAESILTEVQKDGDAGRKRALETAQPFIKRLYEELPDRVEKRDIHPDILEAYGMEKRDLIDAIGSIVSLIFDSGIIQNIIRSILGNKSLIQGALNLVTNVIKSIPWGNLFNAIKNSGIIQKIFRWGFNFIVGLFQNGTISRIFDTLFGAGSEGKSFISRLLTVLVDVGGELFKSLGNSKGLLGEILSTIFNGLFGGSSGSSSGSGSSGSSGSGSGGSVGN